MTRHFEEGFVMAQYEEEHNNENNRNNANKAF